MKSLKIHAVNHPKWLTVSEIQDSSTFAQNSHNHPNKDPNERSVIISRLIFNDKIVQKT